MGEWMNGWMDVHMILWSGAKHYRNNVESEVIGHNLEWLDTYAILKND